MEGGRKGERKAEERRVEGRKERKKIGSEEGRRNAVKSIKGIKKDRD